MRSTTAAQDVALASSNRSTHVRVKITTNQAVEIDLSDFEGYNWIKSVEYGRDQDNPIQTATIQLIRSHYDLQLSPLLDGSKLNLQGAVVDVGNALIVETAVIGMDATPEASDWVEIHRGEIDKVNWGGNPITIQSADNGAKFVRTFMEERVTARSVLPNVYGAAGGDPMEDVIQDILTDHMPGGQLLYSVNGDDTSLPGSAFNASDSPSFNILRYKQAQVPVMQAVRAVTQLIGADVRFTWHNNTNKFELVFEQPNRATSAQGTITLTGTTVAGDQFTLNGTQFDAVASGAGVDEWNVGASATETAKNIAAAINVSSEKDNCYAHVSSASVIITWTPGTAGNAITFTEDTDTSGHFSLDGSGTLGGTTAGTDAGSTADHTFTPDQYTKLGTVAFDRANIRNVVHIVFQDSNGVVQEVVLSDKASIDKFDRIYFKLTETPSKQIDTYNEALDMAGAILADLREPDLEHTLEVPYFWPVEINDIHTYTANGTHYDTDQTLAVFGFQHKLPTNGQATTTIKTRGKPSGGRRRWFNVQGFPGVAPVTTETLGPHHENLATQAQDQLLRNSDLNVYTKGFGLPPDSWSIIGGTWTADDSNTHAVEGAATGDYAVEIEQINVSVTAVTLVADARPFAPGDLIRVGLLAQGNVTEANTDVDLDVRWLSETYSLVATDSTTVTIANGSYSPRHSDIFEAPANTRFAQIRVTFNYTGTNYVPTVDRITAVRELAQWNRVASSTTTGSASLVTVNYDDSSSFEIGADYNTGTDEITITDPGTYAISVTSIAAYNSAAAAAFNYNLELQVDTGAGFSPVQVINQGSSQPAPATRPAEANISTAWLGVLNEGDKVRVRARATNVSPGSATNVLMNVKPTAGPGSAMRGQMLLRANR